MWYEYARNVILQRRADRAVANIREVKVDGARQRADAVIDRIAANDDTLLDADLSHCHLTDDAARKLADALRTNTHLKSLDIKGNDFNDDTRGGAVDLCLMLDGSGSVNAEDYDLQVTFSRHLVGQFALGADQTRVSVIQFSKAAKTLLTFSTDSDEIHAALDEDQPRSSTNMTAAINMAQQEHFDADGRPVADTHHVIILLTDGRADDGKTALEAASNAKEQNTRIIAVGIGAGTDPEALRKLSSSNCDYKAATNFEDLKKCIRDLQQAVLTPMLDVIADAISANSVLLRNGLQVDDDAIMNRILEKIWLEQKKHFVQLDQEDAQELLREGCVDGNLANVKKAIGGGADVHFDEYTIDCDIGGSSTAGFTAIHLTAHFDHPELICFLVLAAKANVDALDTGIGATACWLACFVNRPDVIRMLLERGADPDRAPTSGDYKGITPCMVAAFLNHANCIRALGEMAGGTPVDVNAIATGGVYWKGKSALDAAEDRNNQESVKALLAIGADNSPQAKIIRLQRMLGKACRAGDLEKAKQAVFGGADANCTGFYSIDAFKCRTYKFRWRDQQRGTLSAIHIAAVKSNNDDLLRFLVESPEAGANIDAIDTEFKATPCWWACVHDVPGALRVLLELGADPNRAPASGQFEGRTPCMMAARNGHARCIAVLGKHGGNTFDVNVVPSSGKFEGQTALDVASKFNEWDSKDALRKLSPRAKHAERL